MPASASVGASAFDSSAWSTIRQRMFASVVRFRDKRFPVWVGGNAGIAPHRPVQDGG
jgi:hypothetical protein